MKFEKMIIECKSIKDRDNALNLLKSMGYKIFGDNMDLLFIHTGFTGSMQTYLGAYHHDGADFLSFEQFMQKYGSNTMIEKINQAKDKLKFNNKELSEALGYSRQYITKMLNIPQSDKIQDKVIKEIDALLARDKFKALCFGKKIETKIDIPEADSAISNAINEMSVLRFQKNCMEKDVAKLKNVLERIFN